MKPKFRAWLKKENRMIDPVIGLDLSQPYQTIQWFENEHDALSNNVSDCFMDECELMQYTGLKDKNGKEIYEGDIIRYEWDDEVKIDFMEFSGAMFTVSKAARWNYHRDEVIGNIYENPELLEATP